jgi:hypothetical protein
MSTSYSLKRLSLNNVNDVGGRWQFEGGEVFGLLKGSKTEVRVGYFASYKRVTWGGTDEQNTAMVTLTIFLETRGANVPENITAQGAHDFNTGNETGSISAASIPHNAFIGQKYFLNGGTNVLTIG